MKLAVKCKTTRLWSPDRPENSTKHDGNDDIKHVTRPVRSPHGIVI
jgi:hypothetical protein